MTSLVESATEWAASASSADDPVNRPAASFAVATTTLAANATARLRKLPAWRPERTLAAECRSPA
jgi:hypothetical protein